LRWSITACPPSLVSNAPRGADSRYTTERSRSGRSRAAGVPRSPTVGRRWAAVATRRSSTRPLIAPGLAAAPLRAGDNAEALRAGDKDRRATKGAKVRTQTAVRDTRGDSTAISERAAPSVRARIGLLCSFLSALVTIAVTKTSTRAAR